MATATMATETAEALSATGAEITAELRDARRWTLDLVAGLNENQLQGTDVDNAVNPFLWELGHISWFCEQFVLRPLGKGTGVCHEQARALYDSAQTLLGDRSDLSLPGLEDTLDYMHTVEDATHAALLSGISSGALDAAAIDRFRLGVRHEDMHGETLLYNRQYLGYPKPVFANSSASDAEDGPYPGDTAVGEGVMTIGAKGGTEDGAKGWNGFCFDNERGAHAIAVAPFWIARAPVTNAEFLAFVEDGGYAKPEIWDDAGRTWQSAADVSAPLHWIRTEHDGWAVRAFDRCQPLAPHQPVVHVSHHEAQAWCRWAGRRLPSEAEWEVAAATSPGNHDRKSRFPWGCGNPSPDHTNLDGLRGGCLDVAALAEGDSAHGCRQMLGNVWEWTASTFHPYPGFAPGPYGGYSLPWFSTHMVLRGGSWATRHRIASNTYRNFFKPHRRDIYAGFRTCAVG